MQSNPTFAGDFEVHTTVDLRLPVERFVADCASLGLKPILIELPAGDAPSQPMTSAYYRSTTLPGVMSTALEVAAELGRAGHAPIRLKVEAAPTNADVPETDASAALLPEGNYFEHHLKVLVRGEAELSALGEAAMANQAHLSSNSLRASDGGPSTRFLTLRSYGVGRHAAELRADALQQAVEGLGVELLKRIGEYCVYDDNLSLDDGWAS